MGLSVCLWMGGQREDLEVVPVCLEDLSLSILCKDHTQRAVPVKICKTGREGRMISVSPGQLVRSGTPK